MHWIEWKPKECKDTKEWCAYSVDCTEDFVKSACPKKCQICTGNFRGKNIDPIKFLNTVIFPGVKVLLMLIITGSCWDKQEFCVMGNPNCSDVNIVNICPERCGECAKGNENVYMFDNISWSKIGFNSFTFINMQKSYF